MSFNDSKKVRRWLISGFVSAGIVAAGLGCDDSDKATPAPTATPSAGATNDAAKSAATDLKTQAEAAGAKTADAVESAKANTAAAVDDAKGKTADAADSVTDQAKKLYDQATTAISKANWDDAQKYVDQLKALRDKLPADWQAKVDEVAKMLTDAKAKLGNLPSMPSMPK